MLDGDGDGKDYDGVPKSKRRPSEKGDPWLPDEDARIQAIWPIRHAEGVDAATIDEEIATDPLLVRLRPGVVPHQVKRRRRLLGLCSYTKKPKGKGLRWLVEAMVVVRRQLELNPDNPRLRLRKVRVVRKQTDAGCLKGAEQRFRAGKWDDVLSAHDSIEGKPGKKPKGKAAKKPTPVAQGKLPFREPVNTLASGPGGSGVWFCPKAAAEALTQGKIPILEDGVVKRFRAPDRVWFQFDD